MRIEEMLRTREKKRKASDKTDWEKNVTKLRSKERKLDPQSPVKPIKVVDVEKPR